MNVDEDYMLGSEEDSRGDWDRVNGYTAAHRDESNQSPSQVMGAGDEAAVAEDAEPHGDAAEALTGPARGNVAATIGPREGEGEVEPRPTSVPESGPGSAPGEPREHVPMDVEQRADAEPAEDRADRGVDSEAPVEVLVEADTMADVPQAEAVDSELVGSPTAASGHVAAAPGVQSASASMAADFVPRATSAERKAALAAAKEAAEREAAIQARLAEERARAAKEAARRRAEEKAREAAERAKAAAEMEWASIAEAPVFRPSAEEFKSPMEYIDKIHSAVEPFGICKIIPPPGWRPPFGVEDRHRFRFTTRVQDLSQLDASVRLERNFVSAFIRGVCCSCAYPPSPCTNIANQSKPNKTHTYRQTPKVSLPHRQAIWLSTASNYPRRKWPQQPR